MAEGEVKSASWVGDTVEEFKRLPTWGKIGAGGVVVAVAGLAYWQWKQSQGTSATTAAAGALTGVGIPSGATDTSSGGSSGGTTTTTGGGTTTTTGGGVAPPSPAVHPKPVSTPTQTTKKPTPTPAKKSTPKLKTYTVQRGDNLSAIAAKLHVAGGWQALYNANKSAIGSNPNLIFSGTVLKIPG